MTYTVDRLTTGEITFSQIPFNATHVVRGVARRACYYACCVIDAQAWIDGAEDRESHLQHGGRERDFPMSFAQASGECSVCGVRVDHVAATRRYAGQLSGG